MTFVSSYDPSEDEDDDDAPKAKPRRAGARSSGPRKPRMWVPVGEDGEPLPLDDKQTAKLRERAQNLCLWHLGQGPRTRKQLTDAMTKHGVPLDMAEGVLAKLEEYNYVDDQSFADNYVRSRHSGQQRKGASALRQELTRKGVDAEIIAEALEQVTPESEMENARALVAKKLPSTRRLERHKRVNRLVAMLARKGYPPGVAYQAVKDAIDAEDPVEEDWEQESL